MVKYCYLNCLLKATNFGTFMCIQFLKLGGIFYTQRSTFSRLFKWCIIHPVQWKTIPAISFQTLRCFGSLLNLHMLVVCWQMKFFLILLDSRSSPYGHELKKYIFDLCYLSFSTF